jgi:hypothetical protein
MKILSPWMWHHVVWWTESLMVPMKFLVERRGSCTTLMEVAAVFYLSVIQHDVTSEKTVVTMSILGFGTNFFHKLLWHIFLFWFQVYHFLYSIWHWLQSSKIPANQNRMFSYERNLQVIALSVIWGTRNSHITAAVFTLISTTSRRERERKVDKHRSKWT